MADKKTLSVIIKAVDALSPTLKVVNARLRTVQQSISSVGRAGDKLTQKLGIPLTLFGVSALGGLGATVSKFAENGEEVANAVKKIGGTAQDLQVFRKAAMLANIPTETLDKGLTKLNKNIAEGASGKNKDFAAMMTKLRIPLRNANGELRSAGEILPELSDAFQKNTNAAVRGRIAAVAFGGKMGAELIPMLVDGSHSLVEIREKLISLGAIMGDKAVRDAAMLEDRFKWLKIAGRGLGNTIGAVLAPTLIPLVERLTNWVALNRELIAVKVKEFVIGLANAIEKINWDKVARAASMFGAVTAWLVDLIGGWGNALAVVAVIMNASVVASILGIIVAIGRATMAIWGMGAALIGLVVANPVLLGIAAAVAALGYLAYQVYKNWEPIKAWFANLWSELKRIFVQNIAGLITTVIPFLSILDKLTGGKVSASINAFVGNTPAGPTTTAPSLATAAGAQQVKGSIDININGAPPGTRVTEGKTNSPGFSLNPDVGYNWATMGIPG